MPVPRMRHGIKVFQSKSLSRKNKSLISHHILSAKDWCAHSIEYTEVVRDMPSRGEIYFADLDPVLGSEQGGIRPVLIIQNNVGNRYSPTVIVAAVTSSLKKNALPTHIDIGEFSGLSKRSYILLEQLRTLDKRRLRNKVGRLPEEVMRQVDEALRISVGVQCEEKTFL